MSGSLEVNHQLELRGLLDREVGGFRALEDLVHESGSAASQVIQVAGVGHETAVLILFLEMFARGAEEDERSARSIRA